jgi:2-polyprenyl-6-hydroxyphenyl methylase/3-demethylubiquinone-9 3-methyltransferase
MAERPDPGVQFDFGQNWREFARVALTRERVDRALQEFAELLAGVPLANAAFLDVGFGQGLVLLAAARNRARVVGCDINPKCRDALASSATWFPDVAAGAIPIVEGSILDDGVVAALRAASPNGDGQFDVVHSWGVLHHTGDMRRAIRNAASLVRPSGHFVLAIYNRHWSSPAWSAVKSVYCRSPRWLQRGLVAVLKPIIWLAKLLVTGRNPERQERGMDFHYNVIDWVGGHPYEYASVGELRAQVEALGFECLRWRAAEVPTGCNEFVFVRS